MATTTAAPKRSKPARRPAADGKSPTDLLQGALDDLTAARERAGSDIREGIDAAIDRTRQALSEAGEGAQEQVSDWRASLEQATDDLRRELGLMAVRAQTSPDALKAMSAEIRKRKAELAPSA